MTLSKLSGVQPTTIARIETCERRLDFIESIDYMLKLGVPKSEIKKILDKIVDHS